MNSKPSIKPDTAAASAYVRASFEPSDRLAVVVLSRRTGAVVQRLASAETIAGHEFQEWLRQRNSQGCEVYLSMNALRAGATGRHREDVAVVRHVFLDLDHDAEAALQRLKERPDVPAPNYLLNTSPQKWQVIWKAEGFTPDQAERLQRSLARTVGADIAATDRSRVLRIPGFYNHKYAEPFMVQATEQSHEVRRPEDFPGLADLQRDPIVHENPVRREHMNDHHRSQSERDWAYAKRALARGENAEAVKSAIAAFRQHDKPDPEYYADLTVTKAGRALEAQIGRTETPELDR